MPGGTEQGSPSPGFSNVYILGFAGLICVVASVALAGTHAGLKDIQELNAKRDYQKDVLGALNLPEDGRTPTGPEIDQLWVDKIGMLAIDRQGAVVAGKTEADVDAERARAKSAKSEPELLAVFYRRDGGTAEEPQIGMYAIPVYGRGLWGPISGFLAIGSDATEVQSTVFFAPKETPGLGLEITADWFEDQWVGKRILDETGQLTPIRVVKGKAADQCKGDALVHCVDGVSGATITSRGVTEMVDAGLQMYDPFIQKLRSGQGG